MGKYYYYYFRPWSVRDSAEAKEQDDEDDDDGEDELKCRRRAKTTIHAYGLLIDFDKAGCYD